MQLGRLHLLGCGLAASFLCLFAEADGNSVGTTDKDRTVQGKGALPHSPLPRSLQLSSRHHHHPEGQEFFDNTINSVEQRDRVLEHHALAERIAVSSINKMETPLHKGVANWPKEVVVHEHLDKVKYIASTPAREIITSNKLLDSKDASPLDVDISIRPTKEDNEESDHTGDSQLYYSNSALPFNDNYLDINTENFSLVGEGFCVDQSEKWYSYLGSEFSPLTTDSYCLSWCSQNLHSNLVGVEVKRTNNEVYCFCAFSGGVPDNIFLLDYQPVGTDAFDFPGVGALYTADEREGIVCYGYDNYKRSFTASSIKIELGTGQNIHMFEVLAYSSGTNVAKGKASSQSSTFNNLGASRAVDGKNTTYSQTNGATGGAPAWWKVDLGNEFQIESVTILNRWCGSAADSSGCLCRLSLATLFLIDSDGKTVATETVGNTCGQGVVLFADFLVPTPAPTKSPSYSPTLSFSPTSSLVNRFSFAGRGYCRDQSYQSYSFTISSSLPANTDDIYCLNWCYQNPHPDLVGVEIDRYYNDMFCICDFSGGVPDDIVLSDYNPYANNTDNLAGVGVVFQTDEREGIVCYRLDSYEASSIKIELGTGQDIHMFEVQVYSAGMNVAMGKLSSQSSTLKNYGASNSVDGKNNTFSHTNVKTGCTPAWWKVDLGNEVPIESVTVLNRWCGSAADSIGCLCRLSYATLFLIDSNGNVVATETVGDTCGQKELSFDNLSVTTSAPTLAPTVSVSLIPTSSLVKDFSLVGQGYCVDRAGYYYSFIGSPILPAHTTDMYCFNWCSQNPHPDLVGVEVYNDSYDVQCFCLFSGEPPGDDIDSSEYHPDAWSSYYYEGVGAIQSSAEYYYSMCYSYDNYAGSFSASSIKIELGTGQNIHMFEVQVYSSATNVARGKASSQSSTFNNLGASRAVDGKNNTYSHTNVPAGGAPAWWKVDLGNEVPIESVTILNRWCGSASDSNGCLCLLSSANLFLIASTGDIVAERSFGNTCGKQVLSYDTFF